jgi:hypothetical protein
VDACAPHSAGFARKPRWLQAAGFRLQAAGFRLKPPDAVAEEIVAPREESRKQ